MAGRFGNPADILNRLGAKHFRRRGVGHVDVLARRSHLPVEQLVDPPNRMDLNERAADILMVDHAVTAGLGRPRVNAIVDAGGRHAKRLDPRSASSVHHCRRFPGLRFRHCCVLAEQAVSDRMTLLNALPTTQELFANVK
jgi:hypothetical protein